MSLGHSPFLFPKQSGRQGQVTTCRSLSDWKQIIPFRAAANVEKQLLAFWEKQKRVKHLKFSTSRAGSLLWWWEIQLNAVYSTDYLNSLSPFPLSVSQRNQTWSTSSSDLHLCERKNVRETHLFLELNSYEKWVVVISLLFLLTTTLLYIYASSFSTTCSHKHLLSVTIALKPLYGSNVTKIPIKACSYSL